MAKGIVKKFKEDTLDVIEKEIDKLVEVEGIGKKRIGMIRKAWEEQKEIRAVMLFLQSYGVSSGYAAKIYKQYGNGAIQVVQENPYRLACESLTTGKLFTTSANWMNWSMPTRYPSINPRGRNIRLW
jgi:ATP-dependent exoDNAse (exonuclease V) alpha subunit